MKRKVTDDELRKIVRARLTKGDAFRMSNSDYVAMQENVANKLSAMSRAEIFASYSHYVYDLKR